MKLPTKPNGRKWGDRYEKWLHRDLLLAGYSLAEDPQNLDAADSRSGEEILTQLVALEVQTENKVGRKVREQVFQVLCSFSETDFQEQALELLKARSESIEEDRLRKYRAELGEKEVVIAELLQSLRDEDSLVRGRAALALGELGQGSEAVVTALLQFLRDEDSFVRGSAASALGKLGQSSEAVVTALLQLLRDEDSSVRGNAAYALSLAGRGSEAVVRALLQSLRDESSSVRERAAFALGRVGQGSEVVVTALLPFLRDESSLMRWRAAGALGQLGKNSDAVRHQILEWLDRNSDWKYIGDGIDALWDATIAES